MGYEGYFLKGLSSGLQTGFNMGQMKWQQNEKKRLEKKQNEMMETASIFNNMVAQLGEDGSYSDDDMMKISTSYMALGHDVKERVDGTYKAIQAMDKKTIETNYQWFDFVIEATSGMKSGDAQGIFDTIRPFVSGEKGLQTYEALESITLKKSEIAQKVPTVETFPTAGAVTEAYPKAGFKYTKEGYVPTYEEPEAPTTELDRMAETEKWLDAAYATGNATYFNRIAKERGSPATFKTYKQEYRPEGVAEPKPETVTTLKNWEAMFDIKVEEGPKTEEEYNRALNLLAQSEDRYTPKYATWKEALIAEVKGIAKDLEGISDKEDFNFLLNIYMQKLEEIKTKYPDIDLNQFLEFEEQKGWFDRLKEKVGL